MSELSQTIAISKIRDDDYYFPDGSVVLQVEGVLFKIQLSLLTQESETFRDMLALPAAQYPPSEHSECQGATKEGSCDEGPIIIPGVTRKSFRNFLFMFYGRPSDPEFLSLMKDTSTDTKTHTAHHFYRYLDIVDLSHRFAAPGLEAWALKQLRGQFKTRLPLALDGTAVSYQLRALAYARIIQDKNLEVQIRTYVVLVYSWLLLSVTARESVIQHRRNNLVSLFKYPNLQNDQPSLFGCVFCIILGLGPGFWLHQPSLAREDRIKLLSAHALLTPLPVSKLDLDWIEGTLTETNPRGSEYGLQSCKRCNFQPAWKRIFSSWYLKGMAERQEPSGGVVLLSKLVPNRVLFAQALDKLGGDCTVNCKERFIEFVDEKIEHVFTLFAGFYQDVE